MQGGEFPGAVLDQALLGPSDRRELVIRLPHGLVQAGVAGGIGDGVEEVPGGPDYVIVVRVELRLRGVTQAPYGDRRGLNCACVGGSSNVPLGLSLTENPMMIAMAVWTALGVFEVLSAGARAM